MWLIVVAVIVNGVAHVHMLPREFPDRETCERAASSVHLTPPKKGFAVIVCDQSAGFAPFSVDPVDKRGYREGPFKPD